MDMHAILNALHGTQNEKYDVHCTMYIIYFIYSIPYNRYYYICSIYIYRIWLSTGQVYNSVQCIMYSVHYTLYFLLLYVLIDCYYNNKWVYLYS